MNVELLTVLKHKTTGDRSRERLCGRSIAHARRDRVREAKVQLELRLAREVKDMRGFCKYSGSKSVSQLLGVAGDLVTRDMEKGRDTQCLFWPPFSTGRACPRGSQVPEPASRVCGCEGTVKEDRVKNHLSQLDVHESMGPGRMLPKVLEEPGNVIVKLLPLIFKRPWQLGEVPSDWKKANITHIVKKSKKGGSR